MARVLFIEPFFGGSHRAFAEGLVAHSGHSVELITLPGRYWKWRMRGAASTLSRRSRDVQGADLLFTTSMLNLAEYKGLAGPNTARLPSVLYFHENQLTYPIPDREKRDYHYPLIQLASILAADHVVFNSEYHRREFLDALPALLTALPDHKPKGVERKLAEESSILYPGIVSPAGPARLPEEGRGSGESREKVLLWNHRWEFDKGPDLLLALIRELRRKKLPFRLIVTGAGKHERADVFEELPRVAGDHLEHIGFVESRDAYAALLSRADIVISTARHEFFGISVLEAVLAGAFPLLPERLSYPELFDPLKFPDSYYGSFGELVDRVARLIGSGPPDTTTLRREAERHCWEKTISGYDDLIERIAARRPV